MGPMDWSLVWSRKCMSFLVLHAPFLFGWFEASSADSWDANPWSQVDYKQVLIYIMAVLVPLAS